MGSGYSGYSAYTGVTGVTGMSGMSNMSEACLLSIEEFDESVQVRACRHCYAGRHSTVVLSVW